MKNLRLFISISLIIILMPCLILAQSENIINAPIDVVWKKTLELFPRDKMRIKRISKYEYLIVAERKITLRKKFNRDVIIKLVPRGKQTIMNFRFGTALSSFGVGYTARIIRDLFERVKSACELTHF